MSEISFCSIPICSENFPILSSFIHIHVLGFLLIRRKLGLIKCSQMMRAIQTAVQMRYGFYIAITDITLNEIAGIHIFKGV